MCTNQIECYVYINNWNETKKKYFKKEKLNISEQKSDGIRIKLNDL